jgi:hypothetical protein
MEECGIVLRNVKEYGRENVTNNLNTIIMMKLNNGKFSNENDSHNRLIVIGMKNTPLKNE